jgi:hypothetical protein
MAEPAEPARPAYAVCPRIERDGSTRIPKLFTTISGAKEFLQAEIPPGSLEAEAQTTGLTIEKVRVRRAEREAQLRKERAEVLEKIKSGELQPFDYPFHLRPILNENQGWQDPVPVCHAADYTGPKCARTLRDFLPADAVGPMPALNIDEEFERALEGRSADYTRYLDVDWRFDEIEADARRRPGHEYGGRRHNSIGEIVVKAIHDLEVAFQKLHPDAPCAAVADFWRSWQTQRHIADFCSRLGDSDTARLVTGNRFDGAEEAERARVHVYRQLAAFAHEVLDSGAPSLAENAVSEVIAQDTRPAATRTNGDETDRRAADSLPDANPNGTTEPKVNESSGKDARPASNAADTRGADRRAVLDPILRRKGYSRSKWANVAGVDPSVVYDYMKGDSNPNPESRKALAEAIELPVDELPQ